MKKYHLKILNKIGSDHFEALTQYEALEQIWSAIRESDERQLLAITLWNEAYASEGDGKCLSYSVSSVDHVPFDLVYCVFKKRPFNFSIEEARKKIFEIFNDLDEKGRFVLWRRFGFKFSQQRTLREVASERHVTVERIRQLEIKAIRRLSYKLTPPTPQEALNEGDDE